MNTLKKTVLGACMVLAAFGAALPAKAADTYTFLDGVQPTADAVSFLNNYGFSYAGGTQYESVYNSKDKSITVLTDTGSNYIYDIFFRKGTTDKGIKIGRSTVADVMNVYGPVRGINTNSVDYLSFTNESIYQGFREMGFNPGDDKGIYLNNHTWAGWASKVDVIEYLASDETLIQFSIYRISETNLRRGIVTGYRIISPRVSNSNKREVDFYNRVNALQNRGILRK